METLLALSGGTGNFIHDDEWVYSDCFTEMWLSKMKARTFKSPLDGKAAEAAIAYFDSRPHSISACAMRLGVKRETALRRLLRAEEKGWVTVYAAPYNAGAVTLSRVVGRKVFWPEGLPKWDGDTSKPVF